MTPREWGGDGFPRQSRRSVAGGVVVPKPGRVSQEVAVELLEQAAAETDARFLTRGRTYARAGQVVSVQTGPGRFLARIQGTEDDPYVVELRRTTISGSDRVAAECSCPYGCDYEWCKHAAALAYVAASMLDRDAGVRALWASDPGADGVADMDGEDAFEVEVGEPAVEIDPAMLAVLRLPIATVDARAMVAAAFRIVPHPVLGEGLGAELGQREGEGMGS